MRAILNMEEGERIVGFFLVKEREWKKASNGSEYANLLLERHLEVIPAKLWDVTEVQQRQIKRKSVVKIEGTLSSYRGQKQINIQRIRLAVPEDQVNVTQLISKEGVQREELWQDLRDMMEKVDSVNLHALVKQLFNRRVIRERFTTIPASKASYYTYYAGLLDYIVQLTKSAIRLLPEYPSINKDLILATCFLHEIGKTELFTEAVAPEYTTSGELMGHLILTIELINEAVKETGIATDDAEVLALKHCILSQFGEVADGSGSIVSPKTAEAIFFYHIKELNKKLHAFESVQERSMDTWSYSPIFKRKMYTEKKESKDGG